MMQNNLTTWYLNFHAGGPTTFSQVQWLKIYSICKFVFILFDTENF